MLDAQGRAVSPDGSSFPAEKGAGEGKKGRHTKKKKRKAGIPARGHADGAAVGMEEVDRLKIQSEVKLI